MMRFARRVSPLVALSLLASAATAHAECAWVLWVQVTEGEGARRASKPWEIIQAVGTRQECDQIVQAKVNQPYNSIGKALGLGNLVVLKTDEGTSTFQYHCLPDTVDPRGPKGSR
jgi:hypothetical protein